MMNREKRIQTLESKNQPPAKCFIISLVDGSYTLPDGSNTDEQGFTEWQTKQQQKHGRIFSIILTSPDHEKQPC